MNRTLSDLRRSTPTAAARPEPRALPHYGLLLAASIGSLAVQGAAPPGAVQQVLVTALAGIALLLAFRAAHLQRRLVVAAAVVAATALVLSILHATGFGVGDGAARIANAALLAFGPPAVAVGVLRDLRATGRVQLESVMGVLSLYMLIGMAFGFVYGAVDRLGGAPFFAGGQAATVAHCVYFSFITLTTVGYGDFAARTDAGHTLAVFEALIGQIYLVTIVSVLVSNLGHPARRDRADAVDDGDDPPAQDR